MCTVVTLQAVQLRGAWVRCMGGGLLALRRQCMCVGQKTNHTPCPSSLTLAANLDVVCGGHAEHADLAPAQRRRHTIHLLVVVRPLLRVGAVRFVASTRAAQQGGGDQAGEQGGGGAACGGGGGRDTWCISPSQACCLARTCRAKCQCGAVVHCCSCGPRQGVGRERPGTDDQAGSGQTTWYLPNMA